MLIQAKLEERLMPKLLELTNHTESKAEKEKS
jgi:hypothetical protein